MEEISVYSLEIKKLLKEEKVDLLLINKKTIELEQLILKTPWYSRYCDEIDHPIEELMEHKLYQEALLIILAIKKKEPCSLGMAYYNSKAGICYFELKDYKNAELYFYYAISDDEDYIDEIRPYLDALRNNKDLKLTYF